MSLFKKEIMFEDEEERLAHPYILRFNKENAKHMLYIFDKIIKLADSQGPVYPDFAESQLSYLKKIIEGIRETWTNLQ